MGGDESKPSSLRVRTTFYLITEDFETYTFAFFTETKGKTKF